MSSRPGRALGGLPTVVSLGEVSRHYWVLEALVSRSIPPITGMREAIYRVRQKIEADMESTRYGG